MHILKYYIVPVCLLTAITALSCNEKKHDWKNDFVGSWEAATKHGVFYEMWQCKKNKLMGIGFEVDAESDTLFGEKLELFERAESLVYVAYPGNNRRVEFIGKRNSAGRYSFINKKNDFPSSIEYVFGNKKVKVTLCGAQNGKQSKASLHMVKVK
ncbi:MAG: hypothetical protein ACHQF2_07265 [Flavobacteriales bacterium]